jgi:hypothetical protein
MTILPHTFRKFLHYQVTDVGRPSELIESAAYKVMQMHAEEIEVARRFWACPFQSLLAAVERPWIGNFILRMQMSRSPHINDQPHSLQTAC